MNDGTEAQMQGLVIRAIVKSMEGFGIEGGQINLRIHYGRSNERWDGSAEARGGTYGSNDGAEAQMQALVLP
jgi:hypothetical protein